jgi:hypothetical protein
VGRDSPRVGLCDGFGVVVNGADLESEVTEVKDAPLVRRS